jgi:hypothetical protein
MSDRMITSKGPAGKLDLTGQRFGRLTVVSEATEEGQTVRRWLCRCDCGATRTIVKGSLTSGNTKSCGCWNRDRRGTGMDLTGQRFGRLTVIEEAPRSPTFLYGRRWLCRCDCGNLVTVYQDNLRSGQTVSCDCFRLERLRAKCVTHNMTGTRIFRIWKGMKTRCTNPNVPSFPDYGGRGITVCEQWLNSFESFVADMGSTYRDGLTIDRIDNDGNYSCGHCGECKAKTWPANCRWATYKEQAHNKRRRHPKSRMGRDQTGPSPTSIVSVCDHAVNLS